MNRAKPLVLDATVLSNFASSESISWLTSSFSGLETAPSVERELRTGVEAGYPFLEAAVRAIDDETISVSGSTGEVAASPEIHPVLQRLDRGEAEALVITERTDGTLVTDDMAARELADVRDVPVTGSIGLLVSGVHRDLLSVETADEWLDVWREVRDYYAPVDSVTAVLPPDS
ncbi:hypothetical protein [Halorussus halobius]|uniref:hypothetical protein n=1 Tax=Halorussus halobius TaxID=1710537 RepID=UPI001091D54B|nr:hypothetical protein [Halorussus halobius]